MTLPSPEVYVTKTDDLTENGVASGALLKLVWDDGHIFRVPLTVDQVYTLGAMALLVAAEIKPELVGS